MTPTPDKQAEREAFLKIAQQCGIAHNNGAGGEWILVGTGKQLDKLISSHLSGAQKNMVPAAAEAPAVQLFAFPRLLSDELDRYFAGRSSRFELEDAIRAALAAQPKADSHKTHDWQHHATHFTCKRCGLMSASGQEIVCTGKADSTETPDVSDAAQQVENIEAAIDAIEFVINQRREPGWSYRNTITNNRNVIRAECKKLRAILALRPKAQPLTDGYRVFKDGTQWCAVGLGFVNIQESLCAFNDTPYRALELLTEAEAEEKRRAIRAGIASSTKKDNHG